MEEADRGVPQEDPSVYERCRAEALSTLNYRLVFGGPFLHQLCMDVTFFVPIYLDVILFFSFLLGRYYLCLTSLWTYFLSHFYFDVSLFTSSPLLAILDVLPLPLFFLSLLCFGRRL